MTDAHESDPVDRYEYLRGLSLEEAEAHLAELTAGLTEAEKHYTGPIGSLRRKLNDEDLEQLGAALGDLLPMSTNPLVQQELIDHPELGPEDLLFYSIASAAWDISGFMSRFKNSGV